LIANALNKKAPALLLINDLQAIPKSQDLNDFMQTLYVVINNINDGVLVAITSNKFFFDDLMKDNEAFDQRINKKFNLSTLNAQQAEHMIAKRLLARRMTDELGLVYPFTKESVKIMNDEVLGNPRQLLKAADKVIDAASKEKSVEINDDFIINYIKQSKGREMLPPAPDDVLRQDLLGGTKTINVNVSHTTKPDSLPEGDSQPPVASMIVEHKHEDIKSERTESEPEKPIEKEDPFKPEKDNKEKSEPKELEKVEQKVRRKVIEKPEKEDEKKLDLGQMKDSFRESEPEKVIVQEKIVSSPKLDLNLPNVPRAPTSGFMNTNSKINQKKNEEESEQIST
jgi:hypothetical protein